MNLQSLFNAVRAEPERHALIVAVEALEQQGYTVIVADRYAGSDDLIHAEDADELDILPMQNGVLLSLEKDEVKQKFRLHFLDIDSVCITAEQSLPVMLNPQYTVDMFRGAQGN